jgi:hypothetical protein
MILFPLITTWMWFQIFTSVTASVRAPRRRYL